MPLFFHFIFFILYFFLNNENSTTSQKYHHRIHIISYLLNPKLRHYIFKYVNKTDNKETLPIWLSWASFLSWPGFLFGSFWNRCSSVSLKLHAHNFHLLMFSKPWNFYDCSPLLLGRVLFRLKTNTKLCFILISF